MNIVLRFVTPGLLFLLTLGFGFWLSRSGKPYNGLLFNIHKLIALAAVVVAAIQAFNALKSVEAQPILIALLIAIGLCAAALFVTGALMSADRSAYDALRLIHNVAPFVAVIGLALAIYLLGGGS